MIDSDVAYFFGVETKYLNRQMKRNIERFPEVFCFKLNSEVFKNLRCQNVTFNHTVGSRKYIPYSGGIKLQTKSKRLFLFFLIMILNTLKKKSNAY